MNGKGQELYREARKLIPGGTQLLSKRPEMFLPEHWPSYYSRAQGVETWDLDGKKYLDMSYCGLGSCVLGFADPDVDDAVRSAISKGTMATLNCPEEVELAEVLCSLHPWASMVRFARTGGEAMTMAVRLARAATRRDRIAFCGYHGWHDWYLAANLREEDALAGHLLAGLEPAGLPQGLSGTALPFRYNEIEELEAIVEKNAGELAAIVMEPVRSAEPESGFLERVRQIATDVGAVLIFDEITSGWRLNPGGAHLGYSTTPDVAVFAKAISNGYAMAAVIGVRNVMEAAQGSFISSTYWTERIGPTAALATIRKFERHKVSDHLIRIGKQVQQVWSHAANRTGLKMSVSGIPPLGHFAFRHENAQAMRTLFTQRMLERNILATNSFYATYAHTDEHVRQYAEAVDDVLEEIAAADAEGTVEQLLVGPIAHEGFQRLA